MFPVAKVCHQMEGRVRVRLPREQYSQKFYTDLADRLQANELVERVSFNARTRSFVLDFHGRVDDLISELDEENALKIATSKELPPPPSVRLSKSIRATFRSLNCAIESTTGGKTDLATLTFIFLAIMALRQGKKGKWLPASLSVFAQAMGFLMIDSRSREGN